MKTKDDWFDEGNAALAVGDLPAAENAYRTAAELAPGELDLWHALGMAQYKKGRYEDAIASGLRAVAINPNDQMTWTSLSLAYMKNGKVPEAEAAAAKAKVISWGGKVKLD